eukprot:TRINITY_DN9010_c0_g1_i1.p1 TRINITY_DN9010_c0_g1~~TRINITY_DN9010_c0_g1_i1.p1  ORF type:complete len:148 (+),score=38.72 TRINITY_DN9010_c0_g1_i1:216-659(+)
MASTMTLLQVARNHCRRSMVSSPSLASVRCMSSASSTIPTSSSPLSFSALHQHTLSTLSPSHPTTFASIASFIAASPHGDISLPTNEAILDLLNEDNAMDLKGARKYRRRRQRRREAEYKRNVDYQKEYPDGYFDQLLEHLEKKGRL